MRIPQYQPYYPQEVRQAAAAYCLGDGWFTQFCAVAEWEKQLAEVCGRRHCVCVANGTLALELACMAVFPRGVTVTCPVLTHAATASAIIRAGCLIRWEDVGDVGCLLGQPYDVPCVGVSLNGRLGEWGEVHDAAQSLGTVCLERPAPQFGLVATLSFSHPKILTTGQGGAVLTDDDTIAEKVRSLRDFGRSEAGVDYWLHVGTNAKMSDLCAVLGMAQMPLLAERVDRKRAIYSRYQRGLDGCPGLAWIPTDLRQTCPWFVDVLVLNDRRLELADALAEAGIGTRPCYPVLPRTPAFRDHGNASDAFPNAERLSEHILWLPSSLTITDSEIDEVCAEIRRIIG